MTLVVVPQARAQTAPAATAASGGSRHGIGLGFGQVFLAGDLGTNFQSAIGFNLNYAYEAGPTFGLLVNLHMNSHASASGTNPDDSLSIKGLTPNLKVNLISTDRLTLAAFGGLGLMKISETLGSLSASFTLFAIDFGAMLNVDLDPHFRFGPSLQFITVSEGTDSSATSAGSAGASTASGSSATTSGVTLGGRMFELMFNVMYFF